MSDVTGTLQLSYTFIPAPNPIRASVGGGNPNAVDLQVMVSNSTTSPITLQEVLIQIPLGDNISGDLSSSQNLPSPRNVTPGYTVTVQGSTVTILPPDGMFHTNVPVLFTLPGIVVNQVAGTVYLIITE